MVMPPEKAIAFWKRPANRGLVSIAITSRPPAEKPEMVMLSASPPNCAMLSLTQSSAFAMSSRVKLPVSSLPRQRAGRQLKPNRPSR